MGFFLFLKSKRLNYFFMKSLEIYAVLYKLVGCIHPVADTAIDEKRLDNLKIFGEVLLMMTDELNVVALEDGSPFASVKENAEYARKIVKEVKENLEKLEND